MGSKRHPPRFTENEPAGSYIVLVTMPYRDEPGVREKHKGYWYIVECAVCRAIRMISQNNLINRLRRKSLYCPSCSRTAPRLGDGGVRPYRTTGRNPAIWGDDIDNRSNCLAPWQEELAIRETNYWLHKWRTPPSVQDGTFGRGWAGEWR